MNNSYENNLFLPILGISRWIADGEKIKIFAKEHENSKLFYVQVNNVIVFSVKHLTLKSFQSP